MYNLVIAIYFHPEAYPPTLNAIGELSECFDNITIVHRPHLRGSWNYPPNVTAVPSGEYITSMDQETAPLKKKIFFFFQFINLLFKICREKEPLMILVYDSLSLLAYNLIKLFLPRHKIWYHNHDVTEMDTIRKFSISWFAAKREMKSFKYLDIFSLPTNERRAYFPMNDFKGKYFFIPNYPSKRFYNSFYTPRHLSQPVRVIFQGSIGPYHGIEEIIPLLARPINGYNLELLLKGPCRQDFKNSCLQLAVKYQVSDKLFFLGITPYNEVPVASSNCHIGIGILAKQDVMNTTLGTASNKLYEYAAVGLPVIYYNSADFTRYLGEYLWALPATLNSVDIEKQIISIMQSYAQLSASAHQDFIQCLNFETGFADVKSYIKDLRNDPADEKK